jgi:hypothetical protein
VVGLGSCGVVGWRVAVRLGRFGTVEGCGRAG